ncbi:alpha/beta hydrolase [Enemella evansiae]|uniref:alpha/beta hydrolase n=1 Tax=Enemella evansiae TaxID=2016499 RepID=UPI001E29DE94|nr:alpha/beta hydrolase [Enemella evansiae]
MFPSARRRGLTAAVVAVGLGLVTPLLVTVPAQAAAPKDPPRPAIPAKYLQQQITWAPCSFDAAVKASVPDAPTTNCATITAPMDWNNPTAHPDIKVAIAYSRATGSSKGLLMSNPGGPGGAGLSVSAGLGAQKPQLFKDFDLVGLDPRGFGRSEALRCLTSQAELDALPTTPDRRERTQQTHTAEIAEAQLLAKACSATEFAPFVSTQQTVYDMDLVRALLQARQLNFVGYSYGTWLGGWYADTYPERVGRFVLDSNMDFANTQWLNVNFDPFSGQRRRDQLFGWIARQNGQVRDGLGGTPEQVLARYESIRGGLVSLVKERDSQVAAEGLDGNIYSDIYSNTRFIRALLDILVHEEYVRSPSDSGRIEARHVEAAWARISPDLQAYETLANMKARYRVASQASSATAATAEVTQDRRSILANARNDAASPEVNLGAIGTVVRCNDTAWSKDSRFYLREADRMAQKYPFYGYMNGVPMCAYWQYAPQDRRIDLKESPRVLMVQSELDPATAYEGAERTRKRLGERARFIGIDDEGEHGQYVGSQSQCVEEIGDRFLFTGELPGRDQICGTSPLPEDSAVYPFAGPVDGKSVPLPKRSGSKNPNGGLNPVLRKSFDEVANSRS